MATKKTKAPAGLHPIDAAAWEKKGSFVHGDPYVGASGVARDAKGNPVKPFTITGHAARKSPRQKPKSNSSHLP